MKLKELDFVEKTRTYVFPNGEIVAFRNVTHFVSSATTHRIKTEDGMLHIIPSTGWLCITIEAEDFTL